MGNPLTLEALFGDLNLDLELEVTHQPTPRRAPKPGRELLPARFAAEAENTLETFGFTSAGAFLSDGDQPTRPTSPYDIPENELASTLSLWGDEERFSALNTTPVLLDEVPAEAFPTQLNLVED